ncbi:MAG: hypothetical protein BGO39_16910 [Chloroflexi bacterium 54-19]|nr:MAG: hypothetical protein BGO39_16910 [Chloroflexi bacterium 54-19]
MSEELMVQERRLYSRLDNVVIAFKNLDARVTCLEKGLSPGSNITEVQTAEVGQAVKGMLNTSPPRIKVRTIIRAFIRSYTGALGLAATRISGRTSL